MQQKEFDSDEFANFPGIDLIKKGQNDIASKTVSVEACLLLMLTPQLVALGYKITNSLELSKPFNHRLYELLLQDCTDDAYGTYLALLKRLYSFSKCLERHST